MKLRAYIETIPAISAEEEPELIEAAQAGHEDARKRLTGAYLHLVWRTVGKLIDEADEDATAEAIAEGTCALYKALDNFDPAQKKSFGVYAAVTVRTQVQDWLRTARGVRRVRLGAGGRAGSSYEPEPDADAASLDEATGPEAESFTGHDVTADEDAIDPEDACIRRDLARRALIALEEDLTPSERGAVRDHLLADEDATLEQVAQAYGGSATRKTVQQAEARGLEKIRRALKAA
jgi:RNA polymerase primary sigma factor